MGKEEVVKMTPLLCKIKDNHFFILDQSIYIQTLSLFLDKFLILKEVDDQFLEQFGVVINVTDYTLFSSRLTPKDKEKVIEKVL